MCLAQQTPYLLLDEPLAALDIVYQVEVMQLIRKLVNEQGLTVIIIIHDINLASNFVMKLLR
ncbi:Iron(3+)-hydroxamate import ATP-binding protein FhuC [Mannheimia haemolytica]|uniref:Iron(3+)-hydroxamate import ATP-binding protein FhuC n=1 Tax=Mannheimia haemolytica TaxID=75985 RepID=A0A378N3J6_MANHA|nr:Iron(3+)-hydroxamate import ATP-binding protein FhuC [Mannheimia haemolytica]